MSSENIQTFLEKVKHDTGLQREIASVESFQDLVKLSEAAGTPLTGEDALEAIRSMAVISEAELDGIAGGSMNRDTGAADGYKIQMPAARMAQLAEATTSEMASLTTAMTKIARGMRKDMWGKRCGPHRQRSPRISSEQIGVFGCK